MECFKVICSDLTQGFPKVLDDAVLVFFAELAHVCYVYFVWQMIYGYDRSL